MLRVKKLRTAFLFLPFVFLLYSSGVSVAEDSCFQGLSTIPGNPEYPGEWRDPYQPKIYSDNDEIARNNYVNVWVDSDGKACPPYNWSVSGTGFHFNSASGLTTATTNADLETLQLWADGTACGSATITVTGACEDVATGYVRCTTGQWVLDQSNVCVISGDGSCFYAWSMNTCELIVGQGKQVQHTRQLGGGCCWPTEAEAYQWCVDYGAHCETHVNCHPDDNIACVNCIDSVYPIGPHPGGCNTYYDPPNGWRYNNWCVKDYEYYLWKCW